MRDPSDAREALSLLGEVYRRRSTGILTIEPAKLKVVIDDGQIAGIRPPTAPGPDRSGSAPEPEPDDSVRIKLDRILTEVGLRRKPAWPARVDDIPEPSRGREAGTPTQRVVAALKAPAATAVFEPTAELPADLIPIDGPTEPLILDVLRSLDDAEAIRRILGNLDQRLVTTTALADEQRTLTLTEGYLLSRIDGQCTGREVLQLVPLEPAEAERTLAGLLLTGRVAPQAGPAPTAKPQARPAKKRGKKPSPPKLAPPSELPLELSFEEELSATGNGEPSASEAAPSGATAAAEPSPATDSAEPTSEPRPSEPAAGDAAEPTPEPEPPERTPEQEAERRQILEFLQSLPRRNHFEVLGAERGFSDAELKRAHVAMVKRYHPDRRRKPHLEDLHDVLEAIFIRVGEAWEVLGDAKSRAAYEARLGPVPRPAREARSTEPPSKAPAAEEKKEKKEEKEEEEVAAAPAESPDETLTRARILLGEAKFWDAIQMLETAVPQLQQRQHQHRGRILLARAYAQNPRWVHRAVETLQEVVSEDASNADAHFELGRLYKAQGLAARARASFRKVVELRPGHAQAAAELARAESEKEEGGLLRRLFGGKGKSA